MIHFNIGKQNREIIIYINNWKSLPRRRLHSMSPVSWNCRIHCLYLFRGVRHPPTHTHTSNEFSGYATKQSDDEALGYPEYLFIAIILRSTLI